MTSPESKNQIPLLPLVAVGSFNLVLFFPFLFSSHPLTIGAPTGDLPFFFKPMREFAASQLADGRWPFWNPYTFGGRPFMAEPETCLFYPFTYLFLLLPSHLAFNWVYFIHYVIAGWGMVFLCRKLGISQWSSTCSAIIFTWSAPHLLHMYGGHFTMIQTFAWTPWLVWSLDSFIASLSWRHAALLGLFLGLHFLGGFPLYTYLTGWLLLAYGFFIVSFKKRWPHYKIIFIRLCTGLLLGSGLFLTQAFQAHELFKHSTRDRNHIQFSASYTIKPENLMTLIAPHYYGQNAETYPNDRTYFGQNFIWENNCFMGVAGLILFLAGLGSLRETPTRFWLGAFILSFSIAVGPLTPLFKIFYDLLPGFSLFRGYSKALTIACLALAILAGKGLDITTNKTQRNWVRITFLGTLFPPTFLSLLGWIHPNFLPIWNTQLLKKLEIWHQIPDSSKILDYFDVTHSSITNSAIIASTAVVLVNLYHRGRLTQTVFPALFCLLLAGEFFIYAKPYLKPLNFSKYELPESLMAPLTNRVIPGRVFWEDPLTANLSLPHRVYSVGGYENFPLREYSRLASHLNNKPLTSLNAYLKIPANRIHMRFFGGNFIMSSLNPSPPPGFQLLGSGWVANNSFFLYKSPWEWPRFFIVHKMRPIPIERKDYLYPEQYKYLADRLMKDFIHTVHFSSEVFRRVPGKPVPPETGEQERISILEEFPGRVKLRIQLESPGILVFNENFYPGWKARLNGQTTEILPANLIMKAIFVPKGTHNLEFHFLPTQFYETILLSIVSLLGLLILIFLDSRPFSKNRQA